MIKVNKPDLTDANWLAARARSVVGREEIVAEFDSKGAVKVDDALYKEFKDFLLALFNDKCAYCESLISNSQPGDVEHFRPKGSVADENFEPIKIAHPKWGAIEHPGYFWLAYEWKNLLPACIDCNRYRKHGVPGQAKKVGAGKADRFPVSAFRAYLPDDEARETALLINPCETDPAEHLNFLATGEITPRTKMGEMTLDILGLNRNEKLIDARRQAYMHTELLLQGYFQAVLSRNKPVAKNLAKELNNVWFGRQPYSAVQREALGAARAESAVGGIKFDLPVPEN